MERERKERKLQILKHSCVPWHAQEREVCSSGNHVDQGNLNEMNEVKMAWILKYHWQTWEFESKPDHTAITWDIRAVDISYHRRGYNLKYFKSRNVREKEIK